MSAMDTPDTALSTTTANGLPTLSPPRIWTTALAAQAGRPVRLAGWLHRLRRLSGVSFLLLRDGWGVAQIVVEDPSTVELLAALHNESVLSVTGVAVAAPQAPGGVEAHRPVIEVLFRGLELVTGGQRLHRYEDYLATLRTRGLDAAPYKGYLEAFRHGMPPHGGFGLGLERWVSRLVDAANIRETTLFPRDLHRLTP